MDRRGEGTLRRLTPQRRLGWMLGWVGALVFSKPLSAAPALPNSLATHDGARWASTVAAFARASAQASAPGVIGFIGSSSIGLWTSLERDFPDRPVVRRGFGGSQLADLVLHFEHLGLPASTQKIVIYSGANDLADGKPPEIVLGDFAALVNRIQRDLPETRIAYISIAPNPGRWGIVEQVKRANRLIEEYCQQHDLTFIDVFPHMLGPDGQPQSHLYRSDLVHMTDDGYALWREIVAPYLE